MPEVVGDQEERRCRSCGAGRRGCRGSAPRRSRRARSSARRRSRGPWGSSTSASAIMIRCRIPPENSCGYCLKRVGGMPIAAERLERAAAHLLLCRCPAGARLSVSTEVALDRHAAGRAGSSAPGRSARAPARAARGAPSAVAADEFAARDSGPRRRWRRPPAAGRGSPGRAWTCRSPTRRRVRASRRRDLERDAVDGADRVALGAVPDPEVADVEDRRSSAHWRRPLRLRPALRRVAPRSSTALLGISGCVVGRVADQRVERRR